MADYRCDCGYFLCSSELKSGSVRLVCRRCKKSQRVEFKDDAERLTPSHLEAAGLR